MAGETVAGTLGPIDPTSPMAFLLGGGGGGGLPSLEEIKRRRAVAYALAARQKGFPKTLGEGMTYLGESLGDRFAEDRLAAQERAYSGARTADPLFRPPGSAAGPAPAVGGAVPYGGAGAGAISGAPSDTRARLAALLRPDDPAIAGSPQEVAQMDPTLGAPQAPGGSPSDDPIWNARQHAIGGIESDQDYGAVGVPTKYGRAMGRYGVIEANVPKWTAQALGQPLTPAQFLADPQAQDAVFRHKFGQYVAKYGEEKAARAWYGGEGNINNLDATDAHEKLSVHDYGMDYINRLRKTQGGTVSDAAAIGGAGDQLALSTRMPPNERPPLPTTLTPRPAEPPPPAPQPAAPPQQLRHSYRDQPNPDQSTVTEDIKPMSARTQIAQAGSGMVPLPAAGARAIPSPGAIPSVFDKPTPSPAAPTIPMAPIDPAVMKPMRPKPSAPEPVTTPTDEELRGMAILRKYPGDEQAQMQAQQLMAFGKQRRDAIYARQVKQFDADLATWEREDTARQTYSREYPKLAREHQEATQKQAREQSMFEKFPDGVDKAYARAKESADKVAALPAAQSAISGIRELMNSDRGMFTGSAANMKLSLAKWSQVLGAPYDPRVSDTETFKGLVTPILAALRPAIVGSGAQSLPEFKLLQDAAAGNVTLERRSIENILAAVEKLNAQAAVQHHKSLLANSRGDSNVQATMFGSYELPIEKFIPPGKLELLKQRAATYRDDPDRLAEEVKKFDEAYYTPGLASRILGR